MSLRENERRRRQRQLVDDLFALPDDNHVLTFTEWCRLVSISPRQGRRIITGNNGPTVTQISDRRIGITRRNHRLWLASRARR
jgi:hypothetical protein